MGADQTTSGSRLLSAVEHLTDDAETLIGRVDRARSRTTRKTGQPDEAYNAAVAKRLISSYSNKSAITGSVTALPAVVPGAGTLVTVLGGALADMALVLKFEVELALCLTHLNGFDIRVEQERQIAFLLAAVTTYEIKSGRNLHEDLDMARGAAAWNYGPREVGKLLLTVMSKLALLSVSKGLARAVPFVGIVLGGSVNKVMTTRVGRRCAEELAQRERSARESGRVMSPDFDS